MTDRTAIRDGQVALVTGAGSGAGTAIAKRLAQEGASVVLAGRRADPLEAVAAELESTGASAAAITADVSDLESVEALLESTMERFGRLDTLVSNAGVLFAAGKVTDVDPDDWHKTIDINLTGAFLLARAAIPHLAVRGGSIVTIGSVSSVVGGPASAAYCASKAGLLMLTQCLAVDHAADGIRANCVLPGWIATDMGDAEMDWIAEREGTDRAGAYALANENVPMRRAASPEEIAAAVAYLSGADSTYVTGSALPVDGGSLAVWPGVTLYMDKTTPISEYGR